MTVVTECIVFSMLLMIAACWRNLCKPISSNRYWIKAALSVVVIAIIIIGFSFL